MIRKSAYVIFMLCFVIGAMAPVAVGAEAMTAPVEPATPAIGVSYKLQVAQEGMYRLTYTDLQTAGLPVDTLNPAQLQIFAGGSEIAIFVAGEGDGIFDSSDYVAFYGKPVHTLYTDINTYWLVFGEANGLRMTQRDVTPAGGVPQSAFATTMHFEDNQLYDGKIPSTEGGDHWYSSNYFFLLCSTPSTCPTQTLSYPMNLPGLASGSFAASLHVALRGVWSNPFVNPDHLVTFYLNGTLLGNVSWDDYELSDTTLAFDQSILQITNTVTATAVVVGSGVQDQIYPDWFELTYHDVPAARSDVARCDADSAGTLAYAIGGFTDSNIHAFDVTDANHPTRLVNAAVTGALAPFTLEFSDVRAVPNSRCLSLADAAFLTPLSITLDTPSNLKALTNGADYLVITHHDFLAPATQLANYRASHNQYATAVVDVRDIYDEFSFGLMSQQAIKDFLTFTYNNWQPRPQFVLLMGDATYDPKGFSAIPDQVFVPAFLAMSDSFMGETAADNRYVDVDNNKMPDMHLGRFPVNTVAEAQEMVDRVVSYEAQTPDQAWNRRVIFVADDADGAGNFSEHSDLVADHILPATFTQSKLYFRINYTSASALRTALLNGINSGALFVNYNGHSSIPYWGGERYFRTSDVATLTNAGRWPVMLPMTCLEGYYIVPGYKSQGETVVRTLGRGAIASWSPTGLGVATGHTELYTGFYEAIFEQGILQLGPATTAGKLKLFNTSSPFKELLDNYILFGDPALTLALPAADLGISKSVEPAGSVAPGQPLTYTITVSNTGQLSASGVRITDTLPAELSNVAWSASHGDVILETGSNLVWTVAALAAGEQRTITLNGAVTNTITSTTIITNTAQVSGDPPDRRSTNNSATVTTQVATGASDLGGLVWADISGDGLPNENPLMGLQSFVIAVLDQGGATVATTLSNSSGQWSINGLPPGAYNVVIQSLPGFIPTTPTSRIAIATPGQNLLNLNFGYVVPTGVGLSSFTASVEGAQVRVAWTSLRELNLVGYYVYNSPTANGLRTRITNEIVPAQGNASSYVALDPAGNSGEFYWIEAVAPDGSTWYGPTAAQAQNWHRVFLPVAQR